MQIDLTHVIVALVGLLGTIITAVLVPWLKTKLSLEQQQVLMTLIRTGVYGAEQLFGAGKGEEKKAYVQKLLLEKGYNVDLQEINSAIEAEVKKMNSFIV